MCLANFVIERNAWKDETENQGEVKSEGEPQRVLTHPQGLGNPKLNKALGSVGLFGSFQQLIPAGAHPGRCSRITGSLGTFRQHL